MVAPKQVRKFKRFIAQNINMEKHEKIKDILKPRPKFMPHWLWRFLQNLILDLKEN